jgi:exosortase/archaeosortase
MNNLSNNKEKIAALVEQSMHSLEGLTRPVVATSLVHRILENVNTYRRPWWERVTYTLSKPVVAAAVVLLVLILNTAVILYPAEETKDNIAQIEVTNDYAIDLYNNEYTLP